MARLTADEIARATGGRIVSGDPGKECAGAAIDSRQIQGGEIFFALRGTRTDGHRFVGTAAAAGAGAALVEEEVSAPEAPADTAVIRVADTSRALQDLARHVRSRGVPKKLVGITGSAGKTTTKELLAAMLERRFRIAKTAGNLNNLIGFPLCLLNVPEGTEWMVAEMGMSTAGELRELSLMGRPDAAVFTVVRPVHLEFFASLREIAEAKAELLAGLAAAGPVIANADDPEVARIARRHRGGRVVRYGIESEEVDVKLRNLAPGPEGIGSRFRLETESESAEVSLPLHGLYNAENCLAAAACSWALGLSLKEIAEAVRDVRPASMRGVVHRGRFTLVDDSYNSNPAAVAKALEGAALLPISPGSRRVAILGDMRELGPEWPRFHREAGELAARLGFSPILGVGELSRELVTGAQAAGPADAHWVPDAAAAAQWAAREVSDGDLVLVKASRGVGLDAVVRRLLSASGEEAR